MTNEQINNAIALWVLSFPLDDESSGGCEVTTNIKDTRLDYCGDLSTMRAVEEGLRASPERWGQYICLLSRSLREKRGGTYWTAPPLDRAMAFFELIRGECPSMLKPQISS